MQMNSSGIAATARIRVNPESLHSAAEELEAAADRLLQISGEVIQAASRAPSYDSQFGPAVRALGMEAQASINQRASRLKALAEDLRTRASAFEEAEAQSIQGFARVGLSIGGLLEFANQRLAALRATDWPGEEPPPDEPDDKQNLLERLADQVAGEIAEWILTDKNVAGFLRKVRNLPDIPVVLPMLRGFGMDDLAGPIFRRIDTSLWVRSFGRLIGDAAAPPLYAIGWGLTIAPEQIQNIRTGAPWNEYVADLAIDSGIFGASELAGWAGLGIGTAIGPEFGMPWLGLPLKFGFDLFAGASLDYVSDEHEWRKWLMIEIEGIPSGAAIWLESAIGEGREIEIPPIPTPAGMYSATQTPVPLAPEQAPLVDIETPITSMPGSPPMSDSPEPVATPQPGES